MHWISSVLLCNDFFCASFFFCHAEKQLGNWLNKPVVNGKPVLADRRQGLQCPSVVRAMQSNTDTLHCNVPLHLCIACNIRRPMCVCVSVTCRRQTGPSPQDQGLSTHKSLQTRSHKRKRTRVHCLCSDHVSTTLILYCLK